MKNKNTISASVSEYIHGWQKTGFKHRVGIILLSVSVVLGTGITAFADVIGTAGESFSGPTVNTFAQNMNLQTIYIDRSAFATDPAPQDVNGDGLTTSGSEVFLDGKKLKATGVQDFSGYSWKITYPNAAVYPDGSRANVIIDVSLDKVYTASLDSTNATGTLVKAGTGEFGGSLRLWQVDNNNDGVNPGAGCSGSGSCRSFKAFMTTTVRVAKNDTNSGGTYIMSATGINAYKSSDRAWKSLYLYSAELPASDSQSDQTRIRREEAAFSGEMYYAAKPDNDLDFFDGGRAVAGATLNMSSVDRSYVYGLAVEGSSSGTSAVWGVTAGMISDNSQVNYMRLVLGDLQHRITSGSGEHGTIATGKNGTGTDLEGGSFASDIDSIDGDEASLRRYVIPDAKAGVTYTMTPDKGYTMDKIKVDGTEYTVPNVPRESYSLSNSDGSGVLKYEGGGKFTYKFENANTQDHTIYVTWKKATADIEVYKKWEDNSKAPKDVNVVLSYNGVTETNSVPTEDGLIYKWEDMEVWNFDDNDNATTPVIYTLSEEPSTVSSDYSPGVWSGTDKEGNAADQGFNLCDSGKVNNVREKDDAFAATVTNALKAEEDPNKGSGGAAGKGANTGDDTNAGGWIVLFALSSASVAALVRRRIKAGA